MSEQEKSKQKFLEDLVDKLTSAAYHDPKVLAKVISVANTLGVPVREIMEGEETKTENQE